MSRDAYIVRDRRLVVFWSRKAGNTSLAEWLFDVIPVCPAARQERRPSQYMKKSAYRVDHMAALAAIENEGFRDFVLARNPFDRAVSAYVEKFCFRQAPIRSFHELTNFAQRAFLDIMGSKGKSSDPADYEDTYPGISFDDFLAYVERGQADLRLDGEPRLNAHFSTQVPFSFDGRHSYGCVMPLETIADSIRPLAEALGTDTPFPHSRKNEEDPKRRDAKESSPIESAEVAAAVTIPRPANLLNEQTRAAIRRIYDIDFRMLGYA